MTISAVPYALQNASHPANIFRIATAAPFTTNGILGATELSVAQQASPNMSVLLGAGRATIQNTSVSNPAGQTWNTGGAYVAYNDAALSLTVTTSNPSNPRIDAAYIQIQDSFYAGSTNTAIAGIAAGTPAVSPVAPSIPANSILLALIAVGAGVTSIVTANITNVASVVSVVRGSVSASTLSLLNAISPFPTAGVSGLATSTSVAYVSNGTTFLPVTPYARFKGSITASKSVAANAKWGISTGPTFDATDDPLSGFSTVTGLYTVSVAGTYLISIAGKQSTTTVSVALQVFINGTSAMATPNSSSSAFAGVALTDYKRLNVGDTVAVQTVNTYTSQSDTPADNNFIALVQVGF